MPVLEPSVQTRCEEIRFKQQLQVVRLPVNLDQHERHPFRHVNKEQCHPVPEINELAEASIKVSRIDRAGPGGLWMHAICCRIRNRQNRGQNDAANVTIAHMLSSLVKSMDVFCWAQFIAVMNVGLLISDSINADGK